MHAVTHSYGPRSLNSPGGQVVTQIPPESYFPGGQLARHYWVAGSPTSPDGHAAMQVLPSINLVGGQLVTHAPASKNFGEAH